MKKLRQLLLCLLAIMEVGLSLKAQEVTITLSPGYTWISCPITDTLDFAVAMGSFTPMQGDIIKSQHGVALYMNGRWRGNISQFYPGRGYMYKSNRTEPVTVVFGTPLPQTVVETSAPIDVTPTSAVIGGMVTLPEGNHVFQCGVCWDTVPNPNIDGNHTSTDMSIGSFSDTLDGLTPITFYHARTYMVTDYGLSYGSEVTFTTEQLPTYSVTVSPSSTDGGMATGSGIYEQGQICTVQAVVNEGYIFSKWTENGSVVSRSSNYTFTVNADRNLVANFVDSSNGVVPTGAIAGLFTINSNGDQVYFSQGNLQYIGSASTPYWRFADNQWDYLGTTTGQNTSSPNVDRDLFGWGTSGYHDSSDSYNVNCQPWYTSSSTVNSSYNYYGYGPSLNMASPNLTDSSANYDWGVYNPISNGGNTANQWRTLTKDEWQYIFNSRTTSSGARFAKAKVNNVNGIILLPDNWVASTYSLSCTNSSLASFSSNTISATQWTTLENAGAVFLPTSGYRNGTILYELESSGYYASASYSSSSRMYFVFINNSSFFANSNSYRCYGFSVRLVCPANYSL